MVHVRFYFWVCSAAKLTLVAGRAAHDNKVLRVLGVLGVDELHRLVVDDARVGVIDGAVPADEHLRRLRGGLLLREKLPEARVRVDHVRNALRRVEARDLHDVVAQRPAELVHLLLHAQLPELAHVVLQVPVAERLVEAIEPVGRGAEERELLRWDVARDELVDRMRDEEVCVLDVVPEVLPNLLLRRARDVDQVTSDLDVRTVDDRQVGAHALDQGDESRHLRVI